MPIKSRYLKWSVKLGSFFCVLIFIIVGFKPIVENVEGRWNGSYIYVDEAEDSAIAIGTVKTDISASGGSGVSPDFSVSSGPNILSAGYNFPYSGSFQLYIRAKSESCSSLYIGFDSVNGERFILNENYRWYITHEFNWNSGPQSIGISGYMGDEVVDKIMLIQLKDQGNPTSQIEGQIFDTSPYNNDGDTDMDGIPDEIENPLLYSWWYEAENHFDETTSIVSHMKSASNSKAVRIKGDVGTTNKVPILIKDSFPIFTDPSTPFKFYVKAKGGGVNPKVYLTVSENGNDIVTRDLHFMKNQFRWYSTPIFYTNSGNNLEFQVEVEPPCEQSSVFIDKLMMTIYPDSFFGKITDPLDPDTDFDGLNDNQENFQEIFWFEAEDCVSSSQVSNDITASNSKTINHEGTTNNMLPSNFISSKIFSDSYLYIRARTTGTVPDYLELQEKISGNIQPIDTFQLSNSYEWFFSDKISIDASDVYLLGGSGVQIDKFAIVNSILYGVMPDLYGGLFSDPLDPDVDWDTLKDGVERKGQVYWLEAERHVFNKDNQVQYFQDYASSSIAISADDIQNHNNEYVLTDPYSFPPIEPGIYKIFIRAKGTNLIVNANDLITEFYLDSSFDWYFTEKFDHQGGQIQIQLFTENYLTMVDEIVIVESELYPGLRITDPFNHDTDWDQNKDDMEYSENLLWFEAENYFMNSIPEDILNEQLTNNKVLCIDAPGYELYNIPIFLTKGKYDYYIKAKSEFSNDQQIFLTYLIDEMYVSEAIINSEYRWVKGKSSINVDNPGSLVQLSAEIMDCMSPIYIDSIMLAKVRDERGLSTNLDFGTVYGPNMINIYSANPGTISDPFDRDTDDDKLNDGLEVKLTSYSIGGQNIDVSTDPFIKDSDRDGLEDSLELGVYGDLDPLSKTNPMLADTDNDHIPDGWIDGWGYNWNTRKWDFFSKNGIEEVGASMGSIIYFEGEDINRDGFLDPIEIDPNEMDSDNDDIVDYKEYLFGTLPLDDDTDDDGLIDGNEINIYRTDPLDSDSDDDNLNDGLELGRDTSEGLDTLEGPGGWIGDEDGGTTITDPLDHDTDNDGLPDGWIDGWGYNSEIHQWGIFSNPNQVVDIGEFEDKNLDGKVEGGSWNGGNGGETNPNQKDSDGGDVFDSGEIIDNWNPLDPLDDPNDNDEDGLIDDLENSKYGTDSSKNDTDDDGLIDGEEVGGGSDPTLKDTDDDGIIDGNEKDWSKHCDDDGTINARDSDSDNDGLSDAEEARILFRTSVNNDDSIIGEYNQDDSWIVVDVNEDSGLYNGITLKAFVSDTSEQYSGLIDPVLINIDDNTKVFKISSIKIGVWESPSTITVYEESTESDACMIPYPLNSFWGREIWEWYSDPTLNDTDNDGLLDYEEICSYFSDPNDKDTDDDGIEDGDEVNNYGTNPTEFDVDSDYDGLYDFVEIYQSFTDPGNPDTDRDNLFDGWEYGYFIDGNSYLDPNNPDTDSNGIYDCKDTIDWVEGSNGLEPHDDCLSNHDEMIYGTDPQVVDSDDDDFLDGVEVFFGTDPTDPTDYPQDCEIDDYDGDGLDNDEEFNIFGTNPISKDTDYDGIDDGMEFEKWKELLGYSDPTTQELQEIAGYLKNPDCDNDCINDGYEFLGKDWDYSLDFYNKIGSHRDAVDILGYPMTSDDFSSKITIVQYGNEVPCDIPINLLGHLFIDYDSLHHERINNIAYCWDIYDDENSKINDAPLGGESIVYMFDKPGKYFIKLSIYITVPCLGSWSFSPENTYQECILEEINVNFVKTNPLLEDTDGDLILDIIEYKGWWGFITNPSYFDSDGDGISDYNEFITSYSGISTCDFDNDGNMDKKSCPILFDSDNDKLSDGEELDGWDTYLLKEKDDYDEIQSEYDDEKEDSSQTMDISSRYISYSVNSNPVNIDTDSDGLNDKDEFLVASDPRNIDSDDDNYYDGIDEEASSYELYLPTINEIDYDYSFPTLDVDFDVNDSGGGIWKIKLYRYRNYEMHKVSEKTYSNYPSTVEDTISYTLGLDDFPTLFLDAEYYISVIDKYGNGGDRKILVMTMNNIAWDFGAEKILEIIKSIPYLPQQAAIFVGGYYYGINQVFEDYSLELANAIKHLPTVIRETQEMLELLLEIDNMLDRLELILGSIFTDLIDKAEEDSPYPSPSDEFDDFFTTWFIGYMLGNVLILVAGVVISELIAGKIATFLGKVSQLSTGFASKVGGILAKTTRFLLETKTGRALCLAHMVAPIAIAGTSWVLAELFGGFFIVLFSKGIGFMFAISIFTEILDFSPDILDVLSRYDDLFLRISAKNQKRFLNTLADEVTDISADNLDSFLKRYSKDINFEDIDINDAFQIWLCEKKVNNIDIFDSSAGYFEVIDICRARKVKNDYYPDGNLVRINDVIVLRVGDNSKGYTHIIFRHVNGNNPDNKKFTGLFPMGQTEFGDQRIPTPPNGQLPDTMNEDSLRFLIRKSCKNAQIVSTRGYERSFFLPKDLQMLYGIDFIVVECSGITGIVTIIPFGENAYHWNLVDSVWIKHRVTRKWENGKCQPLFTTYEYDTNLNDWKIINTE